MPTGFTWESYQAALVTQIPSLVTDPNFVTILPACVDYAELSICRDLDLFAQHGLLDIGALTIGTPTLVVPNDIIVLEQLFYMNGTTRIPITPMSDIALNAIYGSAANGPPVGWCFLGFTPIAGEQDQQIEVGPPPDVAYEIIASATTRPTPLSATNDTTYISLQYPDLFWAASMIFLAGYNRNFGAMGVVDDPAQGMSWRAEYARLLKSATVEEQRKSFSSQAWTAESPAPLATPPRK